MQRLETSSCKTWLLQQARDCALKRWARFRTERCARISANRLGCWWSQTGSNRRPPACKAGALPTELWPRSAAPAKREWWAWEDLNFRPHAYQARALTN